MTIITKVQQLLRSCIRPRPFLIFEATKTGGVVSPSTVVHRRLATSAEKRKWKRQGMSKEEKRFQIMEEALVTTKESKKNNRQKEGNPFRLLVVFPVAMTALVVMLRDDLREDLANKGRMFGLGKRNDDLEKVESEEN